MGSSASGPAAAIGTSSREHGGAAGARRLPGQPAASRAPEYAVVPDASEADLLPALGARLADAAVTAEPVNRPAIAVATASRLNARISSPIRPRLVRSPAPRYGPGRRTDVVDAAAPSWGACSAGLPAPRTCRQGSVPRTTLSRGVQQASVERLQGDIDPRVVGQVDTRRHGEQVSVIAVQVAERDHLDSVAGEQPDLIEAGSRRCAA
jgi:hypothetical protein